MHPPASERFYRRWWFWGLVLAVVLVAAVRVALDPVATALVRQGVEGLEGYQAIIPRVHVSLLPFAMTIPDLKVVQNDAPEAEPLVYVHHLEAKVMWRKLLRGELVATASLERAKFVVSMGVTRVTPQMKEAARETVKEIKRNDLDFGALLEQVLPLRLDRVELRESEVLVLDASDPKRPGFWVSDLQMVLDNLVTRPNLGQNAPLTLTMRAVVSKSGVLKVLATADLLEDSKPSFTGQAQLTGLRLESLYPWTSSKAGVSAKGTMEMFANFNSAKGKLSGDVKVMVRNAEVMPANDKLEDSVKAAVANVAIKVLSDRVKGREAVGTTLPIRGNLEKVDAQVWPTILGVVRNAFVEGLDWGFTDLPKPTAPEKEGVLSQAAQALDKDKDAAPKAQPTRGGKK